MVIAAELVDDIKVSGENDNANVFIASFNCRFKLATIASGPGHMGRFEIHYIQEEHMTMETNADDKLDDSAEYSLQRHRQKQFDTDVNQMDCSSYASTNSSIGWIKTAASPICSFYASYLQQKSVMSRYQIWSNKTIFYGN